MIRDLVLTVATLLVIAVWGFKGAASVDPSPPPAPSAPPGPEASAQSSFCPGRLTLPQIIFFQQVGLSVLYMYATGDDWFINTGWNTGLFDPTTVNVSKSAWFTQVVQHIVVIPNTCEKVHNGSTVFLPEHCCWYGVSCCVSEVCMPNAISFDDCKDCFIGLVTGVSLPANNVSGYFGTNDTSSTRVLEMLACNLRSLIFPYNNLTGGLKSPVQSLYQLRILDVGYNKVSGSLPEELGKLTGLEVLALSNNRLTGSVPSQLCRNKIRPLTNLLISNNQLTRNLDMGVCENLIFLEAMGNQFSGSLPSFRGYKLLHIVHLFNCNFTGSFPLDIAQAGLIADLNLADNNLTGTLPRNISDLVYLTSLNLDNNLLMGTLPPQLFSFLGMLSSLSLINNSFTGPLPDSVGLAGSLVMLDISSNAMTGTLPNSLASLLGDVYQSLNIVGTDMSCCGRNFNNGSYEYFDWSAWPRLPNGINFSTTLQPASNRYMNVTGLSCPFLYNNTASDAPQNYLTWDLDPEYYLFYGCECAVGMLINRSTRTTVNFHCAPPSVTLRTWFEENPWIYIVISVVSVGVVFVALLLWLLLHRGTRPLMVQQAMDMRKRLKGPPQGGTSASIVVTDIEGFSNLMKESPELTTTALLIHNNLIRKAKWSNFGFTIEQEGDSYSIAFREAGDAVNFCIQTQLLLEQQQWPPGLFPDQVSPERVASASRGKLIGSRLKSLFIQARSSVASGLVRRNRRSSPKEPGGRQVSSVSTQASDGALSTSQACPSLRQLSAGMDDPSGGEPPSCGEGLAQAGCPEDAPSVHIISDPVACPVMGLRVRMGVATGMLPKGALPASSTVMETAKVVSDAGAGGQVLMCGTTFQAVQHKKDELGCVGQEGMDFSKRHLMLTPWYTLFRSPARKGGNTEEACLLDMGQFMLCTKGHAPPAVLSPSYLGLRAAMVPRDLRHGAEDEPLDFFVAAGPIGEGISRFAPPAAAADGHPEQAHKERSLAMEGAGGGGGSPRGGQLADGQRRRPAVALGKSAAGAVSGSYSMADAAAPAACSACKRLRLYQVLAPALIDRGPFFGSVLALKEEWVPLDKPYYSAPGVEGPVGEDFAPVTTVACTIDGCQQYCFLHWTDAQIVLMEMAAVMRSVLCQVPGGYLMRQVDKEFKFLVAFKSPQDALAWSLAVQECAMYVEWPASALRQWPEEKDDRGSLTCRGPRLKMGIAEGVPLSVEPNGMGRAECHGPSVEYAASLTDAGAHGGQVVCEASLAARVFAIWSSPAARSEQHASWATDPPWVQQPSVLISQKSPSGLSQGPSGSPLPYVSSPQTASEKYCVHSSMRLPPLSTYPEEEEASSMDDGPSSSRQAKCSLPVVDRGGGEACPVDTSAGRHSPADSASLPHSTASGAARSTLSQGSLPALASAGDQGGDSMQDAHSDADAGDASAGNPMGETEAHGESGADAIAADMSDVFAKHLGSFRFKGSFEPVAMVYVVQAALLGRSFPSEAPQGTEGRWLDVLCIKAPAGRRLTADTGIMAATAVTLPGVVEAYQKRWMDLPARKCPTFKKASWGIGSMRVAGRTPSTRDAQLQGSSTGQADEYV